MQKKRINLTLSPDVHEFLLSQAGKRLLSVSMLVERLALRERERLERGEVSSVVLGAYVDELRLIEEFADTQLLGLSEEALTRKEIVLSTKKGLKFRLEAGTGLSGVGLFVTTLRKVRADLVKTVLGGDDE